MTISDKNSSLLGTASISAMDLRREPGKYLDHVDYKNESFIIERAGKPKAAMIPISIYKQIQRDRLELLEMNKDLRVKFWAEDENEVEKQIKKDINQIRSK